MTHVELPPSLASGRFQIQRRPVTSPGKCSVCGSVERPVVDFGLDIEFYGGVLICTECVSSAYSLFLAVGLIGDQSEEGAVPHPVVSNQLFVDSSAINEYVRNANDSVSRLGILLDLIGSPLVNAAELSEIAESDAGELPDAGSGDDSTPVEPVSEPGPDDVSGDTSRDNIFDL